MIEKIDKDKQAGQNLEDAQFENSEGFSFLFIRGVKNAFLNALIKVFSSEATPPYYRYDINSGKSQIGIYRSFPQKFLKFPMIIIEQTGGNGDFTLLDDEFSLDNLEDNRFELGGNMTLGVKLRICSQNPKDMEKLTDLAYVALRFVFRNSFSEQDLAYNKIKISGEEVEDSAIGNYFEVDLSTTVLCQFTNYVDKNIITTLQDVKISIDAVES